MNGVNIPAVSRDYVLTVLMLAVLGVAMTALVLLTSTGPASTPTKVPEWDKIPVRPVEGKVLA
jgi:hypothetical protein